MKGFNRILFYVTMLPIILVLLPLIVYHKWIKKPLDKFKKGESHDSSK